MDVNDSGLPAKHFGNMSHELIAQAEVQGQPRGHTVVILPVESQCVPGVVAVQIAGVTELSTKLVTRQKRRCIGGAIGIPGSTTRRHRVKVLRSTIHEIGYVTECNGPKDGLRLQVGLVHSRTKKTELEGMLAVRVENVIVQRVDVVVVIIWKCS